MHIAYIILLLLICRVGYSQNNSCVDWVEYETIDGNSIGKKNCKLKQFCYKDDKLIKKSTFRDNNKEEWVESFVIYNQWGTDSIYVVNKFDNQWVKTFFYRDLKGNIIRTLMIESNNSKIDTTEFIYSNSFDKDLNLIYCKTSLKQDSTPVNIFYYQYNPQGKLVTVKTEMIFEGKHKMIESESLIHDEKGNVIIKYIKDELAGSSEEWKFEYKDNIVSKESYYNGQELVYFNEYYYNAKKMDYMIKTYPKQNLKRMIRFEYQ